MWKGIDVGNDVYKIHVHNYTVNYLESLVLHSGDQKT